MNVLPRLLLILLLAHAPRALEAQRLLPARFAPIKPVVAHTSYAGPHAGLPAPFVSPEFCEHGTGRVLLEGAAKGAVGVALLLVLTWPITALASVGAGDVVNEGALFLGGAAVGAVVAVVIHEVRCG